MREIKFRAWITNRHWDDENKNWVHTPFMVYNPPFLLSTKEGYKVGTLSWCIEKECENKIGCEHLDYETDNFLDGGLYPMAAALMQYTGLKDKNGKEIYEGDIIKLCHWNDCDRNKDRKWDVAEVYWRDEDLAFCHRPGTPLDALYGKSKFYEVIGNIYENPEFLNEKI